MKLSFKILGVFLLALTAGSKPSAAQSGELIEVLSSNIERNIGQVGRLKVSVKIHRAASVKDQELHRWLKKISDGSSSEVMALSGDKRFIEIENIRSGRPVRPEIDPESTLAEQRHAKKLQEEFDLCLNAIPPEYRTDSVDLVITEIRAFDGELNKDFNPTHRTGTVLPGKVPSTQRFQSLYFSTIGWFIDDNSYSNEVREVASASLLPRTLQLSNYQLSDTEVDGLPCYRLEGKTGVGSPFLPRDVIWLSKKHGFMMVRRELYDPETNALGYRAFCKNPVEILPGVWLPKVCGFEEYAPARAPASIRDKPLLTTTLTVTEMTTEVPDDLFSLTFPPGTAVTDLVVGRKMGLGEKAVTYNMPADPAKLDQVIEQAIRKSPRKNSYGQILIVLNVFIFAGAIGYYFLRKRDR